MARTSSASDALTVRGVHVLGHLRLRLLFSDGLVRDLNLAPMLIGPAFERHRTDDAFFARAAVRHGTVAWPDGSDLDPSVLHGDARPAVGNGPQVLGEGRPAVA